MITRAGKEIDTKQKILDAAERLIAEQGYAPTSLRHIIAEAGVNLAAVHYHFGSKEELLDELVRRKVAPVNAERMVLLERLLANAAPGVPPVERVIQAFMQPMAETAPRHPQFVRVMGRIIAEGLLPGIVEKHFQPTVGQFTAVLRRALPEISDEEFEWRVHFMIGAIAHTMCGRSGAQGDFQTRIGYLVRFVSGGLAAAATQPMEVNA